MSYAISKVVTKKAKPNGFLVFMQDIRDRYREEGQRVPSIAEMVNIANPLWSKLSPQDRSYFNQRAKVSSKSGLSIAKVVADTRLDCLGEPLADRVDEKGQTEERRKTERQFTRARWPVGRAAARCRFYFIDFQFICHVEKGNYYPCEIAAIEYSIECGIIRNWHKFIDPGRIPTGYRWEAQNRSEQTHKIPIEKFEFAENNYGMILHELQKFINPRNESEFPPIFTRKEDAEMVESCCRWLAERTETRHDLFKVYVLEYLLIDLSSHISDIAPSAHEAKDMLSSSAFDYEPGVNCKWHEDLEVRHCSLGVVNRLAYILSDHLCPKYNITMGSKHLPLVTDNQQHTVLSPGPQDADFVFPSRDYRYFPSSRQTPQYSNSGQNGDENESVASFTTGSLNSSFAPNTPVVGSSSPGSNNRKWRGRGRSKMHVSGYEQPEVGGAHSTSGTAGDTLHDTDYESLASTESALNSLRLTSVSEKNIPPHSWYPGVTPPAPPPPGQGFSPPQNPALPSDDYYNPYPLPPSGSVPTPPVPNPAPVYYNPSPSHPQNMYNQQIPNVSNTVPQYNNPGIAQNSVSNYPPQHPPANISTSQPTLLQQPGHTYPPAPPPVYQYPQYQHPPPPAQQPYLYTPPYDQSIQQSPLTHALQTQSYNPNPPHSMIQSMQQPVPLPVQGMLPTQSQPQVPPNLPHYQQYTQYPQNSAPTGQYPTPQYVTPHPMQAINPSSTQMCGANPIQQGAYYPQPLPVSPPKTYTQPL
ncbi:Protein maelstrom-like [Oopsacas minuta]|uniref:Protein maelstrom-like n=1 Tax=Oopsacas minuta TaxID=111878 RepID=A0AAV7JPA4_9METZ|nr:Protein maelstrom-like [Oopsacas minuta]